MQKLHSLKEKLCDELEMYESKTTFSAQDIERIDDLTDIIKNLGKIIKMYEEDGEYSNATYTDRSYRGRSMARNRDSRYSRGYSRNYSYDDITEHLEDMMRDEPNETKRREIEKFIDKMNRM